MDRLTGAQLKKLLKENFDLVATSIRRGQGSSHGWLYITIKEPPVGLSRQEVEKFLMENKHCGSYYSDYGMGKDDWQPCINWSRA